MVQLLGAGVSTRRHAADRHAFSLGAGIDKFDPSASLQHLCARPAGVGQIARYETCAD